MTKRCTWTIHRTTQPSTDGQRRWDLAYQHLLKKSHRPPVKEMNDACSPLFVGLNPAPDGTPRPLTNNCSDCSSCERTGLAT